MVVHDKQTFTKAKGIFFTEGIHEFLHVHGGTNAEKWGIAENSRTIQQKRKNDIFETG